MKRSLTTLREVAFNVFAESLFAGVGILVAGGALSSWAFFGFHPSMLHETLVPVIGGAACVVGAVLWVFRPTLGSVIGTIAALALLSVPASGLFGPRRPDTTAIDRQCDLEESLYESAQLQAWLSGSQGSESADREMRNELDRKRRELHKKAESDAAEKRRTNALLCGLFLPLALLGFFRFRSVPQKAAEEVNASRDLSTPQQRWHVTTGDVAAILAVMAWVAAIAVRSPWMNLGDIEVYLLATASLFLLAGVVMSFGTLRKERLRGCFTLALGIVALQSGWIGMICRTVR